MSWNAQATASTGAYLMATVVSGWNLDFLGGVSEAEVLARVAETARGWHPTATQQERGLLGIGSTFRVFGNADSDVSTDIVAAQVEQALNSFWTIGAVRVVVQVSTTSTPPPSSGSEWSSALQMTALAVIVIGVVWGITQLRKAL